MRILITGHTGFIGSHLTEAYKKNGQEVFGWGRDGVYIDGQGYIQANLMDLSDVGKILRYCPPDLILHCAGSADVNGSIQDPVQDLKSNYITTHNLLFAMREAHMLNSRFILMSSAAVYGNPVSLPVTEKQEINPLSPYALHKKAAEDTCIYMHKNHGYDVKILRIFSAYGPGLKKQIFWDMYQKVTQTGRLDLWGSGNESRDYIYIDDLIQAIMLVSEKAPYDEILYNVANGDEIKIKEAAMTFARNMGFGKEKIRFVGKQREGDPLNWKGDISKLSSLGYERKVAFEEGIRHYIGWAKQDG